MLASVVLVSLDSARNTSKNSVRLQEMKAVVNALELYRLDDPNGNYPNHSPTLTCSDNTCLSNLADDLVTNGYIEEIPLDPDLGDIPAGYRYCRNWRSADPGYLKEYTILISMNGNTSDRCVLRHPNSITDTGGNDVCWMNNGVPTISYDWCN